MSPRLAAACTHPQVCCEHCRIQCNCIQQGAGALGLRWRRFDGVVLVLDKSNTTMPHTYADINLCRVSAHMSPMHDYSSQLYPECCFFFSQRWRIASKIQECCEVLLLCFLEQQLPQFGQQFRHQRSSLRLRCGKHGATQSQSGKQETWGQNTPIDVQHTRPTYLRVH